MDPARALDGMYATAYWLLEEERETDAVHVFRAMLYASPADERAWLGLGHCHERFGQPTTALQLYELAVTTVGSTSRLELARARILLQAGETELARDLYATACELASAQGDESLAGQIDLERGRA